MFVCHQGAIALLRASIVEPLLRQGDLVRIGLDQSVQFDDLLLLIVHFQFVVELAEHLLLAVEAGHLFSQCCAEHFV